MMRSPTFPKFEKGSYIENAYDPQLDFYQVLEEARKNAINFNQETSFPSSDSIEPPKVTENSWKRSLCSWWSKLKTKKSLMNQNVTLNDGVSRVMQRRKSSVSNSRSISGPLAECFTPTRVEDHNELPYMCLSQHKFPSGVQAYGPIYLVT
ncbi:uncharacterized protein A4U43_C03F13800 [Asparagus officinalis]|uniref:Uncharacterized protein n=1 Tax=Asparagus officinalis TaxID=4686 RepID=A0A5P1FAF1_ASPOF|nr:uncharacterized protein LOC109832188 [Asparagus officinalis]XP_020255209.1 uncharacterized protein LOC109832188 [Asparagus officinalis]ONK75142.1 uncharacterized protein A4U43_C03F13800 [Asparagus officinalis]